MRDGLSRRQFLQASSAATLAGAGIVPSAARARSYVPAPFRGTLCLFSKSVPQLNWQELATSSKRAGFGGIDLTVRRDGHVMPAARGGRSSQGGRSDPRGRFGSPDDHHGADARRRSHRRAHHEHRIAAFHSFHEAGILPLQVRRRAQRGGRGRQSIPRTWPSWRSNTKFNWASTITPGTSDASFGISRR